MIQSVDQYQCSELLFRDGGSNNLTYGYLLYGVVWSVMEVMMFQVRIGIVNVDIEVLFLFVDKSGCKM